MTIFTIQIEIETDNTPSDDWDEESVRDVMQAQVDDVGWDMNSLEVKEKTGETESCK